MFQPGTSPSLNVDLGRFPRVTSFMRPLAAATLQCNLLVLDQLTSP